MVFLNNSFDRIPLTLCQYYKNKTMSYKIILLGYYHEITLVTMK